MKTHVVGILIRSVFWPQGYKTFFMLNSAEHEMFMLINLKLLTMPNSFLLNIAEHENFSLLINMKMPTIVGIFIFISWENFMLSWVEHEKSFITLGPDQCVQYMFYGQIKHCSKFWLDNTPYLELYQRALDVYTTSHQRRCNVVVSTSHVCWDDFGKLDLVSKTKLR